MKVLVPLQNRILVLPTEAPNITVGGILIPDSAKEKPITGEVVMVGEGETVIDEEGLASFKPMILHPGDTVLFGQYTGTEVIHLGRRHLIMRETDVISIVEL